MKSNFNQTHMHTNNVLETDDGKYCTKKIHISQSQSIFNITDIID